MDRYKFGDIVEWSTARWMIVRWTGRDAFGGSKANPNGYDAVWLGHDKGAPPESAGFVGGIGRVSVAYDGQFKVETFDE